MFKMSKSNYDVFISYETKTGTSYAENLKEALEKNNKHICFFADLNINKDDEWRKEINEALEECKCQDLRKSNTNFWFLSFFTI